MPMPNKLGKLLDLLPLHAEEGRLRDSVSEDAIIEQLDSSDSAAIVSLGGAKSAICG